MGYDIVGVGTSSGGLAALRKLVAGLPGDFALPLDSHLLIEERFFSLTMDESAAAPRGARP